MESAEESLRRLNTDYIDLYQPHVIDTAVSAEETMDALHDLVRQGKVRAIGLAATNATAAEMATLQETADARGTTPFVSMQANYNMLIRQPEAEILPALRRRNMSLLPFWPLANGLLTGKYRRDAPNPVDSRFEKLPMVKGFYGGGEWRKTERIRAFAEARRVSMVDLAFAWLLGEPLVSSVIAGASKPEQVAQNARAAGKKLPDADLASLDRLLRE
jgi:aryl-alcohol dehydrogenase-like predicted oxidoreductase